MILYVYYYRDILYLLGWSVLLSGEFKVRCHKIVARMGKDVGAGVGLKEGL